MVSPSLWSDAIPIGELPSLRLRYARSEDNFAISSCGVSVLNIERYFGTRHPVQRMSLPGTKQTWRDVRLESVMRPNADVGFSDRYLYESQLRCPILIPTASKFAIHRLPRRSEAYRQAPCLDGVDDEIIEWLKRRKQRRREATSL